MKQYIADAFTVKEEENYRLRWFTPGGEIDLCGHATLGTAFVLMKYFIRTMEPNQELLKGLDGLIAPFWADQLGKSEITAFQASERTGVLYYKVKGEKVTITGKAALYSVSELFLEGIAEGEV